MTTIETTSSESSTRRAKLFLGTLDEFRFDFAKEGREADALFPENEDGNEEEAVVPTVVTAQEMQRLSKSALSEAALFVTSGPSTTPQAVLDQARRDLSKALDIQQAVLGAKHK